MRSDINHTSGLASQQAARIEAIDTISRLRKEAREEISRLIQFLDLSDEYAMTELEDDDDREEVGDTEPSPPMRLVRGRIRRASTPAASSSVRAWNR